MPVPDVIVEVPVPDVIGLGLTASASGTTVYVSRFQRWQVDLMHAELRFSGNP